MKILVITYHYPPDRPVGGQRANKVVDAFRVAGHAVTVIAAGQGRAELTTVDAIRVRPLPSVRDLLRKSRRFFPRRANRQGPSHVEDPTDALKARVPTWKRWIHSLTWLPDDRQGFIFPAVKRALHLRKEEFDLVYTTAPPFSVHLVGLILKAASGVKWAAEFRDPWSTNPFKPENVRSAFSDWAERNLEKLCLGHADLVVAVSEGIASDLKFVTPDVRILVIRNGIENIRDDETVTNGAGASFRIVHAGSFYRTRDPFPFLDALSEWKRSESSVGKDLTVQFIGATERYNGRSIQAFIQQRGLADTVQQLGWMQPKTCLDYVYAADALLLYAVEQPRQIPNKLYDYLGARRPILAIADDRGESAGMLRRCGNHEIVPINDSELILGALKRLLQGGKGLRNDNGDLLVEWTTARQMAKLVGAIESDLGR